MYSFGGVNNRININMIIKCTWYLYLVRHNVVVVVVVFSSFSTVLARLCAIVHCFQAKDKITKGWALITFLTFIKIGHIKISNKLSARGCRRGTYVEIKLRCNQPFNQQHLLSTLASNAFFSTEPESDIFTIHVSQRAYTHTIFITFY